MINPASDEDWLAAAARLAARGKPLSSPNPSVGAIVVKEGHVVGSGWTQPGGRPHAEAMALAEAGNAASGSTIFVTLEPCAHSSDRGPACADLIVKAKPEAVVIAAGDPDERTDGKGIARLRESGIEVRHVDCPQAKDSLAGYFTRSKLGRPHVTLKLAASIDGKIALPDGESQWITGGAARAHVHARRAQCDAILVGGATWRADRPRLNVRLAGLEDRSPKRVILTRGVAPDGIKVINAPAQISALEGVQYLYVEGGAGAAASFLGEDLVDRIELYRAPIMIGKGHDAIGDLNLDRLANAHDRWLLVEQRQLGSDSFAAYERIR